MIVEIGRVASQTTFNGGNLPKGVATTLDIVVGALAGQAVAVTLPDADASTLGFAGLALSSASTSQATLGTIDSASTALAARVDASAPRRIASTARCARS